MVEYARKECDDCHGIFPGQVMRRRRVKKKAGYSVQPSRTHETPDSYEHRYKYVELLLCPDCRSKRTVKRFVAAAFLIACAVGFIAYASNSGSIGGAARKAPSSEASPALVNMTMNEPVDSSEPEAQAVDEEEETGDLAREAVPEVIDDAGEPDVPEVSIDFDTPVIRAAILKALDKGKGVFWRDQGLSGYAVVSAPTEIGSQTCRNVYFSIIRGDDQEHSPTRKMCKSDEGEWVAEAAGIDR